MMTKGQKKYKVTTIKNELGLHARSAAQIARIAGNSQHIVLAQAMVIGAGLHGKIDIEFVLIRNDSV